MAGSEISMARGISNPSFMNPQSRPPAPQNKLTTFGSVPSVARIVVVRGIIGNSHNMTCRPQALGNAEGILSKYTFKLNRKLNLKPRRVVKISEHRICDMSWLYSGHPCHARTTAGYLFADPGFSLWCDFRKRRYDKYMAHDASI